MSSCLFLIVFYHFVHCYYCFVITSKGRITVKPLGFQIPFSSLMPNMPGNIYVDRNCIDCDACRWICPTVYGRHKPSMQTHIKNQPRSSSEKVMAFSAMLACPTNAIKMLNTDPYVALAETRFPVEINRDKFPFVHHCGFHSSESYGATPYIIYRANGNVMIDCPRYDTRCVYSTYFFLHILNLCQIG